MTVHCCTSRFSRVGRVAADPYGLTEPYCVQYRSGWNVVQKYKSPMDRVVITYERNFLLSSSIFFLFVPPNPPPAVNPKSAVCHNHDAIQPRSATKGHQVLLAYTLSSLFITTVSMSQARESPSRNPVCCRQAGR